MKEPSYFDIFNFAKIESSYGFCFGIGVVKNSQGACVFCTAVIGVPRTPYKYGTKYKSPLRVFDNFRSKAKTIATFNFCKLKVARFLPWYPCVQVTLRNLLAEYLRNGVLKA